jgi:hypothetical protein
MHITAMPTGRASTVLRLFSVQSRYRNEISDAMGLTVTVCAAGVGWLGVYL